MQVIEPYFIPCVLSLSLDRSTTKQSTAPHCRSSLDGNQRSFRSSPLCLHNFSTPQASCAHYSFLSGSRSSKIVLPSSQTRHFLTPIGPLFGPTNSEPPCEHSIQHQTKRRLACFTVRRSDLYWNWKAIHRVRNLPQPT